MTVERCSSKNTCFSGLVGWSALALLTAGLGLSANAAFAQTSAGAQTSTKSPAAATHKSAAQAARGPQAGQQTFASCQDASKALLAALQSDDDQQLLKVLGPNAKDIVSSGDEAADKAERQQIVEKYQQMHRLVMEPDDTTTIYIGSENWPMPIPLMQKGNEWYFDTAAGKQQILYRRIGRNELGVIQVCTELVDAEKEYYGQAHDGESANHYAVKFWSDPGKHNGLYWKASSGEPESPIGPLVAEAVVDRSGENANHEPQPFDGYYFKTLKAPATRGTAGHSQSFATDGGAEGGFAFLAYPAKHRSSGVMTFIVDQDGVVYEKDLGPRTEEIAKAMTTYHRDATWRKAD